MEPITPTARTQVRRHRERGAYDRDLIHSILDEALICHVGFVVDGQPFVIPTIHARIGDRLYIHGSAGSRMLKVLKQGSPVCVTATLIDGLVLARSAFHHSMNYRSVLVFGQATEVVEPEEKRRAFDAIVNHVCPGRAAEVRPPDERETQATTLLTLPIQEASAKVRSGPPVDAEEDYALPLWAGVVPLKLQPQAAIADTRVRQGTPISDSVATYVKSGAAR